MTSIIWPHISRSTWWVIAVLIALTLLVTWPLAMQLASSLPSDYGDPVFTAWAIGWVGGKLTEAITNPAALSTLWDANIFHPEPGTLAYSEHFIGPTVMVLPVYWLTGNLTLAYNIAFLASFVLTGLGTYLLTRTLTGSSWGGLLAAVVASFNQYRFVFVLAHLHVLSIQWFPFALLALHRYFETDRRRYLVYAAAALIAVNLFSIYYAAYCAPLVIVFALLEMVRFRRWTPRVWLELWATAAFVMVASLPLVLPYFDVGRRLGIERSIDELIPLSASLDGYQLVLGGMTPALIVAAAGLVGSLVDRAASVRWTVAILVVLLALAFWLSLGPVPQAGGTPLGWPAIYALLYEYVPGYRGLRAPHRFATFVFIFLGLLAGAGIAVLERRWRSIARIVAAVAAIAFVSLVAPRGLPLNTPIPSARLNLPPAYLTPVAQLPAVYQVVASLRSDAVLVEFPFGDMWYDLRYMYFAATHRRRLLNGYSGIFPPSYLARRQVLGQPARDPPRAVEAIAGATHAIVHPAAWPNDTGKVIRGWLDSLGATLIAEVDGAAVYELPVKEALARVVQK